MNDHERTPRDTNDVPGHGRVGGIDDPVPRSEYGDDPDAIAGAEEAPPFPDFAADRAASERYAVEREPHPHHDGTRLRIHVRNGAPAMLTVLRLIRDANADGWLLDKHSDNGDELVLVPGEDGENQ